MNQEKPVTPSEILQLGSAFWASKVLLSAVELGVFTELAKGPKSLKDLTSALKLHTRSSRDFFDALVSLKMLRRSGDTYQNTPETDLFLDKKKPSYVGGLLEMLNSRLYKNWGGLTASLKSGLPANEESMEKDPFKELYADEHALREFTSAMTGVSLGPARALAEKFPWNKYKTFVDVGSAQGAVPVTLALQHPHLTGGSFDLPAVKPIFEEYVKSFRLENRVRFQGGDFFKENLPNADVIIMGHILHDWGLADKMMLLKKAYAALPSGGSLIVYEALIDDDRSQNTFGLLMSLNMLVETPAGFDYTGKDCAGWMKEVGFKEIRVEHLLGPNSMVIAVK